MTFTKTGMYSRTSANKLKELYPGRFSNHYKHFCYINKEEPSIYKAKGQYYRGIRIVDDLDLDNIRENFINYSLSIGNYSKFKINRFWPFIFQYNLDITKPGILKLSENDVKALMLDYSCRMCGRKTSSFDIPIHSYKTHICSEECKTARQKELRKKSSIRQTTNNTGAHNTYYHNEEERINILLKQSSTMKNKISRGEFTPCVTNSWTGSKCMVYDIKLRSSWEAMFYLINPHLEYEKIRVPYIGLDNKVHNYITDFQDYNNKIIYEVKPNSLKTDDLVIIKENAAKKWCEDNGWTFVFISDDWIKDNKENIKDKLPLVLDLQTKKLMMRYL